MKRSRMLLIAAQFMATVLFIINFQRESQGPWISWATPLAVLLLIVVNSFWFTRFVSWLIFSISFFSFCVLLSAFTIGWRLVAGFDSKPFYMSIVMYLVFVYVGLGQLKILGGQAPAPSSEGSHEK